MTLRAVVSVAGLLFALTACSGSGDRPGNQAVYDRIDSLTDCEALQQEFDTASASHDRAAAGSDEAEAATGYMEAADSRLRDLDCY